MTSLGLSTPQLPLGVRCRALSPGTCRTPFTASREFERRCSHSREALRARERKRRYSRLTARAGQDEEDLPWVRKENLQKLADAEGKQLPFPVYLLGSAIIAIAAVGSIFEIINQNAIFGIVPPSNPLWLPILGFFALTGLPSAGFLFFKAIAAANAESDRQNKIDGY